LIFSPQCGTINERLALVDGKRVANINSLRMDREYEGRGHMSRLVKIMELYAKEAEYTEATIGVEAGETRNLGIYLHWGYNRLVLSEVEDGSLFLYYAKDLSLT